MTFDNLRIGGVCGKCGYVLKRNYDRPPVHRCGPLTHRDKTKSTDCRHRGEYLKLIVCETCQGKERIIVFECTIHGQCSLAKSVGVAVCARCDQYETEDNHD